ncbi:unnamed protein product, partial [Rotaria sp. Silwood1]
MNNCQNFDISSTSPVNIIDELLSIAAFDSSNMKNILSNNELNGLSHKSNHIISPTQRKHRLIIRRRLAWNITGPKQLERAEKKMFETLKSHFGGRYVPVLNNTHQIWTVYSNLTSDNIPIVLVHGFGGGIGLWSLTLDQLCSDRPVY